MKILETRHNTWIVRSDENMVLGTIRRFSKDGYYWPTDAKDNNVYGSHGEPLFATTLEDAVEELETHLFVRH